MLVARFRSNFFLLVLGELAFMPVSFIIRPVRRQKRCANPLGQRMTFRGESLAAVALCACLAVSKPAFAEQPSYAQSTKYDVDISGGDLTTALPALSRQTGVVVLYPYELAQVRSNPVKGLYTVPEALQLMLQGTGFSGDVTARGAVSISRQRKHCDTEGEAMLRDSKTSVSVIALLASLFSAPVCAQTVAACGRRAGHASGLRGDRGRHRFARHLGRRQFADADHRGQLRSAADHHPDATLRTA